MGVKAVKDHQNYSWKPQNDHSPDFFPLFALLEATYWQA